MITQVEFPVHLCSITSLKLLVILMFENTSEKFIQVYVSVGLKLPVLNIHHTGTGKHGVFNHQVMSVKVARKRLTKEV